MEVVRIVWQVPEYVMSQIWEHVDTCLNVLNVKHEMLGHVKRWLKEYLSDFLNSLSFFYSNIPWKVRVFRVLSAMFEAYFGT
jgi:hypothetical protein